MAWTARAEQGRTPVTAPAHLLLVGASSSNRKNSEETEEKERTVLSTPWPRCTDYATAVTFVFARQQACCLATVTVDVVAIVTALARVENAITTAGRLAVAAARIGFGIRVRFTVVALFGAIESCVSTNGIGVCHDAEIVDGPATEFQAAVAADFVLDLHGAVFAGAG